MGAGLSKEKQYQIVYRELHRLQRELAARGVRSRYKKSALIGGDGPDGEYSGQGGFCISYRRVNASNGRCVLWPIAQILFGDQLTEYNGAYWMPGPSWKTAEPRIVELFARQ